MQALPQARRLLLYLHGRQCLAAGGDGNGMRPGESKSIKLDLFFRLESIEIRNDHVSDYKLEVMKTRSIILPYVY